MDWRLVASTFALVFFAELGDKTQLTALAISAGERKPWSVFAGAAGALAVSALLAVLLGSLLGRLAKPQIIKTVAGVLFLVFGVVLLVDAWRGARPAAVAPAEAKPGLLTRIGLELAAEFEDASATDYRDLAARTTHPHHRALFEALAAEEEGHLAHLRELVPAHPEAGEAEREAHREMFPAPVRAADASERSVLEQAIAHERTKAEFYEGLARTVPFRALRATFARLAEDERGHLARLQRMRQA